MRVSVVIPCFNAGAWIDQTLDSVVGQQGVELDVVVVDDGSSDDSRDRVAAWTERAPVRLLTPEPRGAAASRNTGLAASRGAAVQFLDADDLLAPGKLAAQVAALDGRDDRLACADWARFRRETDEVEWPAPGTPTRFEPRSWLAREWRTGAGMLFPARWLIPRALLDRAGGWDESLSLLDDLEFFARLIAHATDLVEVPAARCYYRSNIDGSLSGRKDPVAMASGYAALERTENAVRALLDDDGVRRGLSLCWQRFAQGVPPHSMALADRAERHAFALHPARLPPEGGLLYRTVARVAGWRWARRMQRWRAGA